MRNIQIGIVTIMTIWAKLILVLTISSQSNHLGYDDIQRTFKKGRCQSCHHADNDTKFLLSLIKEAGFDMAECFVTAPMVHCTLAEARQNWGNDVIIWGGIPSSILCPPVTDEVFETYMEDLFRTIVPGDTFILGVADNVMPDAYIERVIRVSEMVEAYGKYPVGV